MVVWLWLGWDGGWIWMDVDVCGWEFVKKLDIIITLLLLLTSHALRMQTTAKC
jgi:hypothetical protein